MKDKIYKLKNVFQKYGFIGFLKKVGHYISANYGYYFNLVGLIRFQFSKSKHRFAIQDMLKEEDYDRIIIWRSSFGWNVPLFQRPQHISNNLSKQKCLVLYEVTSMTDDVIDMKKIQDNLYLINFKNYFFTKLLLNEVKKIEKPKYLQFYSTDWTLSIKDIKKYENDGFRILYEYIDDINPALAGTKDLPKNVKEKYEYAMGNLDVLVVVTADLLRDDVISKRGDKNLAFSSNGVDYQFFQSFDKNYSYEDEFQSILNKNQPVIGYYGALASWFDYDMLITLAKTKKYQIVLFGVKYDDSFEKSNVRAYENIHFLGARDYAVLKYYAMKMSVLTIPFLINDITRATSPVKVFEYMALHKPIVTTDMNECRKYQSVFIAKNKKDFVDKIEMALSKKEDEEYLSLLDREAKENDWYEKAKSIVSLLLENE